MWVNTIPADNLNEQFKLVTPPLGSSQTNLSTKDKFMYNTGNLMISTVSLTRDATGLIALLLSLLLKQDFAL